MTSQKLNKVVLCADAELTDWDGHIALIEPPALSSFYSGEKSELSNGLQVPLETCARGYLNNGIKRNDGDDDDETVDTMSLHSERDDHDATDNDEPHCSKTEHSRYSFAYRSVPCSPTRNVMGTTSSVLGRCGSAEAISRPPSSYYQQLTAGSSMVAVSLNDVLNDDYQSEHEPTSLILDYCKRKFLRPFMIILSVVGLNPISTDTTKCRSFLSYFQCLILVVVLIFGYFLQYLSSYRGDRGFSANLKSLHLTAENASWPESENHVVATQTIGELIFGYLIPFLLDLAGYISAIVCCKLVEQEQLQNLIERTFLMSMQPKRLCRMLWLHIGLAFLIFLCLYAYVVPVVVMQSPIVRMKWLVDMESDLELPMKISLLSTIAIQDIIEIIILSSYCIECYLLKIHLISLSQKLLLHSIDSLDWMREILEFRKLLDRLNNTVSIPVSFFIVMNLAYTASGFIFMLKDFDFHYSAFKIVFLNFLNVVLWLLLGLLPFFMAASLTQACQSVKANGHQIRVRPFVYHNTSNDDLNSMLMFASTLDMSTKLFRMPIQSNYLCFAILVISVLVLTVGMCFNISLWGIF